MSKPKVFKVSQVRFLDNIEAEWRRTLGIIATGHVLNNAVRINRLSETSLEVETDGGKVLRYDVKEGAR